MLQNITLSSICQEVSLLDLYLIMMQKKIIYYLIFERNVEDKDLLLLTGIVAAGSSLIIRCINATAKNILLLICDYCRLHTVCCLLSGIRCINATAKDMVLFTADCILPTAYCLLPTANFLPIELA